MRRMKWKKKHNTGSSSGSNNKKPITRLICTDKWKRKSAIHGEMFDNTATATVPGLSMHSLTICILVLLLSCTFIRIVFTNVLEYVLRMHLGISNVCAIES